MDMKTTNQIATKRSTQTKKPLRQSISTRDGLGSSIIGVGVGDTLRGHTVDCFGVSMIPVATPFTSTPKQNPLRSSQALALKKRSLQALTARADISWVKSELRSLTGFDCNGSFHQVSVSCNGTLSAPSPDGTRCHKLMTRSTLRVRWYAQCQRGILTGPGPLCSVPPKRSSRR